MKMVYIREIVNFLSAEVIGDDMIVISNPAYLFDGKKGELVYCDLKSIEKDLEAIKKSEASCIICSNKIRRHRWESASTLVFVDNPKVSFGRVLRKFFSPKPSFRYAFGSYVGNNVEMGINVKVHPNVVIYNRTNIGNNVIIRAGVILGAEGLDYERDMERKLERVPHISGLEIGNNVDIGPNTVIQRGVLRPTKIGEGTKIGPNCNIGHEVTIGKHCIITGGTMIAGSTIIGDYVYIAPQCIIKKVNIGNHAFIGIGSLVFHDVAPNTTAVGRPAIDIKIYRKQRKKLKKILEDFYEEIEEKKIK